MKVVTMMSSPYGRSGIRRSGDNYQDLIALELMVDFLEHQDRYEWFILEADGAGSLDDIVGKYVNGSLFFKQVKFSGYPDDPDDPFDMLILTQSKGNSKSLLKKWYDSLKKIQNENSTFEASLESNRQLSSDLNASISHAGLLNFDNLNEENKKLILSQIPSEEEARWFFSKFKFNTNLPNYDELFDSVVKRFHDRGVTVKGWLNIFAELKYWVMKKNEPKPDGKITLPIIKTACLWDELERISQKFPFPSDFVIPSTHFHESFLKKINETDDSPIVLQGKPGTGKSSYLSNLYKSLRDQGIPVIRHHYFLSTRDYTPDRLDSRVVKASLMAELQIDVPDLSIYSKRLDTNKFPEWLKEVAKYYSEIGKNLVIIIDGLDHVSREYQSKEELDKVFRYLLPPREGIKIIIGTQPLVDEFVPSTLLRYCPKNEWLELPLLDLDAMKLWIRNQESFLSLPDSPDMKDNVLDNYAEQLYIKSKGHPLYLYYLIQEIKKKQIYLTYNYIKNQTFTITDNITPYYKSLTDVLSEEAKYVLSLYVNCPFALKDEYIVGCLLSLFTDEIRVNKSIHEVLFLLHEEETGRRIYHDSLRNYLLNDPVYVEKNRRVKVLLLTWLKDFAPQYLKWNYLSTLQYELGDDTLLLNNINMTWVQNSLNSCYPIDDIIRIINSAIRASLIKEDLPKSIAFGYLRDYLIYAKEFRADIVDNLFKTHINLDLMDDILINVYLEKVFLLSNSQILDLSRNPKLNNYQKNILYNELYERQKGNRPKYGLFNDRSDNSLISFLKIAFNFENLDLESLLLYFKEISDEPAQLKYFNVFCKYAYINKKTDVLLSILEKDLSLNMLNIAIKYAIFLSFEEKYEIPDRIIKSASTPLIVLYQYVSNRLKSTDEPAEPPSIDIFNLSQKELYKNKSKISKSYYDLFYYFLANWLTNNVNKNLEYISKTSNFWVKNSLIVLEKMSEYASAIIIERKPIDLSILFRFLDKLSKPTWRWNRENVDYSESLESVLHSISIELLKITEMYDNQYTISKPQLQKLYDSQYFDPLRWYEQLTQHEKNWFDSETLQWIHSIYSTEDLIEPYTEKTTRLSIISTLFAQSGCSEFTQHYISLTNQNLVTYGDRKDVNLFYVLNVLELAYEYDMAEARNWLKMLIQPILYVEQYTDGKETEHLRKELANLFAKFEPEWFETYYRFNLLNENYKFIDDIFSSYANYSDLNDEVNKIVLESMVDVPGISILIKKRNEANLDAKKILDSMFIYLGKNIENVVKEKEDYYSHSSDILHDRQVSVIGDYPPEKLTDYIESFTFSLDLRREIEKWFDYWIAQGKSNEILENVHSLITRGVDVEAYDRVFDLTLQLKGKTEAYPWLIIAQNKSNSWYTRWENKSKTYKRWEKVKLHYPEKWYEFLKESLLDFKLGDYEYLSIDMYENIVKYCLFNGQVDLAEKIIEQMVHGILTIVLSHNLPSLKWVSNLE